MAHALYPGTEATQRKGFGTAADSDGYRQDFESRRLCDLGSSAVELHGPSRAWEAMLRNQYRDAEEVAYADKKNPLYRSIGTAEEAQGFRHSSSQASIHAVGGGKSLIKPSCKNILQIQA